MENYKYVIIKTFDKYFPIKGKIISELKEFMNKFKIGDVAWITNNITLKIVVPVILINEFMSYSMKYWNIYILNDKSCSYQILETQLFKIKEEAETSLEQELLLNL